MSRTQPPPANQRSVRRHNLGIVLRHVADRGPRSRAKIALETGLNKSTVSSLVTELIELGLLGDRGAERRGGVGRPGLVVELAGDGAVGLGLEAVVLGGYFATLAEWLLSGVERELHERVLAPEWALPRVLASRLGPEAAVRGAAAQVLHNVLADPAALAVPREAAV